MGVDPERIGDGGQVADGGHAALVPVREGCRSGLARQPVADQPAHVGALLDRGLGHARQVVQPDHVPDGEDLGKPGQGQIRLHRDPSRAIEFGVGRFRKRPGEWRGGDASCPDDGPGLYLPDVTAVYGDADRPVGYLDNGGVQHWCDTETPQGIRGPGRHLRLVGRQDAAGSLD